MNIKTNDNDLLFALFGSCLDYIDIEEWNLRFHVHIQNGEDQSIAEDRNSKLDTIHEKFLKITHVLKYSVVW